MSGYQKWCEARGVTHAHLPHDCQHPQPFMLGEVLAGILLDEGSWGRWSGRRGALEKL